MNLSTMSHSIMDYNHFNTGSGEGSTCYWKDVWRRLYMMRKEWQLCDVSLLSEDGMKFMAHSAILAASSSVFQSLFLNASQTFIKPLGQSEYQLHGVYADVLQVTIDFIYGVAPETIINFKRLQKGAEKLGISAASSFCRQQLFELEQLAKGEPNKSPPPVHKKDRMSLVKCDEIGESRKDTASPSRAQDLLLQCPYLSNLSNDTNGIVPLKKRFLLKVLSQLKEEESPGRGISGVHTDDIEQVIGATSKSSCQSTASNVYIATNNTPSTNDTNDDASMLNIRTPLISHVNDSIANDGNSTSDDTGTTNILKHSLSNSNKHPESGARPSKSSSVSSSFHGHSNCYNFNLSANFHDMVDIPHPIPDLAFGDMGIQCPHLQKLVGKVDTYTGIPIDVMDDTMDIDPGEGGESGNDSYESIDVGSIPASSSGYSITELVSSLDSKAGNSHVTVADSSMCDVYNSRSIGDNSLSNDNVFDNVAAGIQQNNAKSVNEHHTMLPVVNNQGNTAVSDNNSNLNQTTCPVSNKVKSINHASCPTISMNSEADYLTTSSVIGMNSIARSECDIITLNVTPGALISKTSSTDSGISSTSSPEGPDTSLADIIPTLHSSSSDMYSPTTSICTYSFMGSTSVTSTSSINSDNGNLKQEFKRNSSLGLSDFDSQMTQISSNSSMYSDNDSQDGAFNCIRPEGQGRDMNNEEVLKELNDKAEPLSDGKFVYLCIADGCDYKNKNIEYLQSHLYHRHSIGDPKISCDQCERRYFSESQLKTHIKQTHDVSVKHKKQNCSDCGEMFKTSQSLQMHLLKVHGKGKLFSCEDCPFKSPRKKDLQGHMISQHNKAPPGVRVYECEHCLYKCIDKNRFNEHEASHTQERNFKCDFCGNFYATRRGLRNHLKYHSNERPHECNICNATFKVRAKLRDHIRLLHLQKGEKPYRCGHCNFRASVRGNVNQHIRNVHKGQPIEVIDLMKSQRKHVKDYDYANLTGNDIKEVKDASAVGYASVGTVNKP